MRHWVIGDLHGCAQSLERLLDTIAFRPDRDRLWLVGDLINRGPDSQGVLDWIMLLQCKHPGSVESVLGNHDIHALVTALGIQAAKPSHKLDWLLQHPNPQRYLDWLRHRPALLWHSPTQHLVCHAGLLPSWDVATALQCAHQLQSALRSEHYAQMLGELYGDTPDRWHPSLHGMERLRCIVNALTRLRFVDVDTEAMVFDHKCHPYRAPTQVKPWFHVPALWMNQARCIFGHWAQLGFFHNSQVLCLDSGCVWGNALSAYELRTGRTVMISAQEPCFT